MGVIVSFVFCPKEWQMSGSRKSVRKVSKLADTVAQPTPRGWDDNVVPFAAWDDHIEFDLRLDPILDCMSDDVVDVVGVNVGVFDKF
jgi:hypothetical protein